MTYKQETKRFLINRVEKGWVVLEEENGKAFEVPEAWLPEGASAGDVLLLRRKNRQLDSGLHFFIDLQSRKARQEEIEDMLNELLHDEEEDAELREHLRNRRE